MNSVNFVFACILLLILLVLATLILLRRRSDSASRPADHLQTSKSRFVRFICGVSGLAALATVTLGTWQAIPLDYVDTPSEVNASFRVPTKPVAPPLKTDFLEVPRSRLLIHLVAVEASPAGLNPLHVEQIDAQWPRDKEPFKRAFQVRDYHVTYSFVLKSVYYSRTRSSDRTPTFKIVGQQNLQVKDSDGNAIREVQSTAVSWQEKQWPQFGKRDIIDVLRIRQDQRPAQPALSSIPRSARGNIHLLFCVTRAADDDPLTLTSWAGFCRQWGERGEEALRAEVHELWSGASSNTVVDKYASLRGLALLGRWGGAGLLLVAAAILLTQSFVHRVQAFPAVLAAVVLYSAVLDRAVLQAHISRLDDPRSSLTTRMVACDRLGYTFFFRRSAVRRLEALFRNGQTPDGLRYLASDVLRLLTLPLPRIALPTDIISSPGLVQVVPARKPPTDPGPPSTFAIGPHPYPVQGSTLSHDGRLMAVVTRVPVGSPAVSSQDRSESAVQVWDVRTAQVKNAILYPGVESFAFAPDGRTLAVLSSQWKNKVPLPVVRFWDINSGSPRLLRTQLLGPSKMGQSINSITYSPDGKRLLCSSDSRLELWELAGSRQGTPVLRWSREYYKNTDLGWTPLPHPALSPDGKTLALVAKVHWVPASGVPEGMLVSPGGGAVQLWDMPAAAASVPRLRRTLPTEHTRAVAFSPDGKSLACTRPVYQGGTVVGHLIQMFDLRTGKSQWSRLTDSAVNVVNAELSALPFGLPISPDGKMLAIVQTIADAGGASIGSRIELWDTRTGKTLRKLEQLPTVLIYQGVGPSWEPVASAIVQFSADRATIAVRQGNAVRLLRISDFWAVP